MILAFLMIKEIQFLRKNIINYRFIKYDSSLRIELKMLDFASTPGSKMNDTSFWINSKYHDCRILSRIEYFILEKR